MANSTRARTAEEQWRDVELRIQEVSNSCNKKIVESITSMETRLMDKMDQLILAVSGCDAKIEAYNASMEERIKAKIAGVVKSSNLEKIMSRDGEIWMDRSPILQNLSSGWIHQPRLEIPNFSGEDPRSWIRKCDKFFLLYQVSDSLKVELVEMYLDGKVDVWYQSYKLLNGMVSWNEFCESLIKRFGRSGGLDVQEEFNKLYQSRSLMEYVERFEELKSLVLCKNVNLGERYFMSSFISGLRSELKPMVRMMKPTSLMDAIEVAQFQEQTIEILVKKHEGKKSGQSTWGKTHTGVEKNIDAVRVDVKRGSANNLFKKISPEEFQYRKNNHLCYKCGDNYAQGHVCKNEQYTFMLIDDTVDKEIVQFLDEEEDEELNGAITELSLNALSESMVRKTITLDGYIKDRQIKILVDTGSSLTVINSVLAKELDVKGVP
ncbi:hypothetical protein POM88_028563 [Heracleum sosnowskyi]|uniref:Retrotransposon gag domain-containing protein n=1 Tax=Heracleum sosnowskyi TaxID=360622 RepID=A0AAD8HUL2_9APIA|nr:hypothetical protein POM88_028563 [Heracleum sosnowskyi]